MKILALLTSIFLLILFLCSCAPKTSEQYCRRASSYKIKVKNINASDSLLRIAIKLDSTNHLAYCLLGENVSSNASNLEKKRKYYLKAISIDSTKTNYFVYYGQTYYMNAIEYDKDRNIVSCNYTQLYKAIEIFSRGISIDSTNHILYSQRAYCYNVIGDSILAVCDMFKAARYGDKLIKEQLLRMYSNKAS